MMWIIWGIVAFGLLIAAALWKHWDWASEVPLRLGIVGIILLAAFLFAGVATFMSTRSCEASGQKIGYEAQWTLYTDCLVETEQGWYPLDQVLQFRNDHP